MALTPTGHTPVLAQQVCELLAPCAGESVLDATVGLGGHAKLLAEAIGATGRLIGLDVDPGNLAIARERLAGLACPVDLVCANFVEAASVLDEVGLDGVDVLLADLGVSSPQLDDPERGFSFRGDGPLDMRLDPNLRTTAADLVNRLKEKALADVLFLNAQEVASRRIARAICYARRRRRITTTGMLAEVVARALHVNPESRRAKIHPATRTFLALRIEVNDELGRLERLLAIAPDVLKPGGRIGVIAFHSLEDKRVKVDFRTRAGQGIYGIRTKKPVVATEEERQRNPRSRSAKLRVAVRLSSG